MRILLTGATGYIGSRVLTQLVDAGHEVTAVVRNEPAALKASDAGATPVIGDLYDAEWLAAELAHYGGAIHTAAPADGTDADLNDAVIDAAITAFSGTEKPFVLTGGVWVYGQNDAITEDSPIDAPPITAWRVDGEARLLASDVKASVIEPGIVYGYGTGIVAMLASAVQDDTLTLIGSGEQHWTTIHVDDLAELYVAVLENAPGGHKYLGVSGDNPTVRELGEALASTVTPEDDAATLSRLGEAFGTALLLDQQASGAKARAAFSWEPTRPTAVELLAQGYPTDA